MSTELDAIVIGTGHAGPSLADRMGSMGMRVALIDDDADSRRACEPELSFVRALSASARLAHLARRGDEFGLALAGPIGLDWDRASARAREIALQSSTSRATWIDRMKNVETYRGLAHFVRPNVVEVEGRRLSADKIFINVGTRPSVPKIDGLEHVPHITSETLIDLAQLPEHLLVIGGAPIALEVAQTFRRLGSQVTLAVSGTSLIANEDEDVAAGIRDILLAEGIRIRTGAECMTVSRARHGVVLQLECGLGAMAVSGSHLFIATGSRPRTETLGLEAAGVETNASGEILVDESLQTSADNIWALGECNSRSATPHDAFDDVAVVGSNLFEDEARTVRNRVPCYALFVDPPLGRVGLTEREVRASGREFLVGKWPMSNVAITRERGEAEGFLKILVDAENERILGAAFLGHRCDEVVHSLLGTMHAGFSYKTLARTVPIHSTISAVIPKVLHHLAPSE